MKHPVLIAGALALGLIVAGAASAQPQGGGAGAGVRQACAADFQKFCPDAKPGKGGGLRECVVAHHDNFSDACKSAIASMRAARQQGGAGAN
jgi:hypothetical protein